MVKDFATLKDGVIGEIIKSFLQLLHYAFYCLCLGANRLVKTQNGCVDFQSTDDFNALYQDPDLWRPFFSA